MNHHELTVARDPSPFPGPRGGRPETPPPADEQAANLSFADALRCFCAKHARPVNPRDGAIEAAMLVDLRLERVRPERTCSRVSIGSLEFLAWANARRTPPTYEDVTRRFPVSRSTAYRWVDGYKRVMGLP